MRRPSLTPPPSRISNGVLSTEYEWRGKRVWVYDSARSALLCIELFANESLAPEVKAQLLPDMLFPDPEAALEAAGDDPRGMLRDLVWEAYGLDITGEKAHDSGQQAFCWNQDAARIKASLMAAYNIDWDRDSSRVSFCDMAGLLGSLMETRTSTPFSEAIEARLTEPPKPTKNNRELRAAIAARKSHFALKSEDNPKQAAQRAEDAMADMFAAAKRAAMRRG